MLVVLVPVGAIAGGMVGSTGGFHQLPKTVQRRKIWLSVLVAYLLLIAGILLRLVVFRAA